MEWAGVIFRVVIHAAESDEVQFYDGDDWVSANVTLTQLLVVRARRLDSSQIPKHVRQRGSASA